MKLPLILTAEDFGLLFREAFWLEAAQTICRRHKLSYKTLTRAEHGENIVFLVDEKFVIKIYTPFKKGFEREKAGLEFVAGKTSLVLPEILHEGAVENFSYLVLTQNKGVLMTRDEWLGLEKQAQVKILSQLAEGLKQIHSYDARKINFDWQKFIKYQMETVQDRQKSGGANSEWLEKIPFYLENNLKLLPENAAPVFLHGDVHFGNLRFVENDGKWKISALFDYADSLKGLHEYDFVAIGVLMIQGQGDLQREFFRAYGYAENDLDENLRRRLMLLTILYEHSNLRKYALRLRPEAVNYTLEELEKAIWNFVCEK